MSMGKNFPVLLFLSNMGPEMIIIYHKILRLVLKLTRG